MYSGHETLCWAVRPEMKQSVCVWWRGWGVAQEAMVALLSPSSVTLFLGIPERTAAQLSSAATGREILDPPAPEGSFQRRVAHKTSDLKFLSGVGCNSFFFYNSFSLRLRTCWGFSPHEPQ